MSIHLKDSEEVLSLRVTNSLPAQPPPPHRHGQKGIGQQLIDGFARQLRGRIERSQTDEEFHIALIVPKVDTPAGGENVPDLRARGRED